MANPSDQFQNLVDCLLEQKEVYTRITEVITSERMFLILADIDSLVENNKLKEALLAKSRDLEKLRLERLTELASALNLPSKDWIISELIRFLPNDSAKTLIVIQAELGTTLQALKAANSQNEKLANNAKSSIENALKGLKGEGSDSQTYKKQGKLDTGKSAGKLVSKEV